VRALVALAVAALFWLGTYRLANWTHERFRAAGAIGVLEATVLLGLAAVLLIATLAVTAPGFVVALAALHGWQVPRRLGRAGRPAAVARTRLQV
jgi:energy-converting hydrogenase Eha subunit B